MGGQKTRRAALCAVAAVLMVSSAPLHAEERSGCPLGDSAVPARVRTLSPPLQTALHDGIRRSAQLARLVSRIDESDGLVYLEAGGLELQGAGRLLGGLSHSVVVGPNFRLLRIVVWRAPSDQTIATIAHELQHALEVLDAPEAVDAKSVGHLYDRIGFRVRPGVYETDAAQRAGDRVRTELSRCRS